MKGKNFTVAFDFLKEAKNNDEFLSYDENYQTDFENAGFMPEFTAG